MNGQKIQVLIVEDQPIIAADLKKSLIKLGYDVIADVDTGQKVLDVLASQIPDVILMDIKIKGSIDGVETAAIVQEQHDIPIIFVTSNSDKLTFQKAMKTNPNAFLSKPFRIADVANSIEMALLNIKSTADDQGDEVSLILEDRIFIREKTHLSKILIQDILYIVADGSYAKIHTADREYTISYNLSKFVGMVNHHDLLRVHRSYVINVKHVSRISPDNVLIGDEKILVSKSYREDLNKRIRAF